MSIHHAIEDWQALLGLEQVNTSQQDLITASIATFATNQKIPVILNPGCTKDIQECMKIANKWRIPIYPISGGKNWGYGSRVPVLSASALLNLSRMNQIIDYSDKLGTVTLEAGVTQAQLYRFLVEQGGRFWMDATGASPESSVIGNTVNRGFGHTPYGDHFSNVCGFEVVLPSGEVLHTGFGRFPGSKAISLYRWGIGPSIDGLFSQSNLGIVTKMSVWLMPAPETFKAFYFSVDKEDDLNGLVESLRPLRLSGVLRSAIHIGNAYKVISAIRQYPWDEANGRTPLPDEILSKYARIYDFGAWSGAGAIYGSHRHVSETARQIRKSLKGTVRKLRFLDDTRLSILENFSSVYRYVTGVNMEELLKILRPVYGLMKGIPTGTQITSSYWRSRSQIPEDPDPDRDGIGLMWCSPIAPLTGEHAAAMSHIAQKVLTSYDFEPSISITLLTERVLGCVISISYDRNQEGEDDRAMLAYNELLDKLMSAGYFPYRSGIQSMQKIWDASDSAYRSLLSSIKTAIDPNGVLAPGSYIGGVV